MTAPTANDHLVQARANRAHAEWLLAMRPSDSNTLQWAVTATFYSALHGLTAYLLAHGVTTKSHTARGRALAAPASGVPLIVLTAYRMLEVWSREARYDLKIFSSQNVRDMLDQELATVAAFVGM